MHVIILHLIRIQPPTHRLLMRNVHVTIILPYLLESSATAGLGMSIGL